MAEALNLHLTNLQAFRIIILPKMGSKTPNAVAHCQKTSSVFILVAGACVNYTFPSLSDQTWLFGVRMRA